MHATTIAVDLAKSVFQVSLADQSQNIISRKRLTRTQFERLLATQPPANVVMEACATANYWSQYAQAHGHQTRLLHALYVRPFVRRNKTDTADADALIQANLDPELHAVPTKTTDQQALQALHRCRQQLIDTRNRRINLVRGVLAEFGLSLSRGVSNISHRLNQNIEKVPVVIQPTLHELTQEITSLKARITNIDKTLATIAASHPVASELIKIPGIGVIVATAMIASVPDIHIFTRARQFSAWLGITPREHSSGNRRKLGSISKRGNTYLRTMLIHGARSAMLQAHRKQSSDPTQLTKIQRWAIELRQRRPNNIATVALANKMARIIWATWRAGQYR